MARRPMGRFMSLNWNNLSSDTTHLNFKCSRHISLSEEKGNGASRMRFAWQFW